jgi:SH3-like domain-containing protein
MRMRWDGWISFPWNWLLGIALLSALGLSHGCVSDLKAPDVSGELPEPEPLDSLDIPIDRVAICIYEKVGLRQEPGSKKKTREGENNYIVTITYGEKVEMILDSTDVESGGRNYMFVRLLDGQEGWVHDYVFEKYGRLAVMTDEAEIHRRPHVMTIRDDKFKPGEIVVVIEENPTHPGKYGEWLHVSYRDKKKKGFIQRRSNLSFSKQDVQVALLFYKAKQESTLERRITRLEEVAARDITKSSLVRPFIVEAIEQLKAEADPNYQPPKSEPLDREEKLYVTLKDTWLHDEPSEKVGAGISQLPEGAVCTIIDRGEHMTIAEMSDYWYHVRYEDMEGWIFGYFTSRRQLE